MLIAHVNKTEVAIAMLNNVTTSTRKFSKGVSPVSDVSTFMIIAKTMVKRKVTRRRLAVCDKIQTVCESMAKEI
jgi:hypothetical protein